ncbi:hypothetical protein RCO48_01825 [Peribacillus frigoritolerans]|nr:hypothetical protein [Peribacillus frigoritolerans]
MNMILKVKKPHVAGVIVYEGNMSHSHYQAKYSIGEYFRQVEHSSFKPCGHKSGR